jgi:hypothetical protein
MEQTTFEYLSDWAGYFESVLRNEIRDEIDNRNRIKANIVESNQTLDEFVKRNPNMKIIPSKESFFHNIEINIDGEKHYLYIDDSSPRFWVIHNIELRTKIQKIIENITTNNYLQDSIYLSHEKMDSFQTQFGASSLGFKLNFEQMFASSTTSAFTSSLNDFDEIGFTMHLWPKRKKSIKYFLDQLKKINCPVNYKSLNFVFEDEGDVLIKEDLYYNGAMTINRGKDFRKHLNFINGIKKDYSKDMEVIEDFRIDWKNMKGGLYLIEFDKEIYPQEFVKILSNSLKSNNDTPVQNSFKIKAFFMYKDNETYLYTCLDEHTGGKFYLQVSPKDIRINLDKDSCGNIIFRLFTNLQRYFSMDITLFVDGGKFGI